MTSSLTWRWLTEYARRPLNVILLFAVPIVFVSLAAGVLSDFADILSDSAAMADVEVATAAWSAAALAGVSGFFHVATSRDADRRLARAGSGSASVVASRMISAVVLAGAASAGSILALRLRSDLATDERVIVATMLSATIYAGIGVTVGALMRSELNGSLIVVFIWIFDVFFGPAMGGTAAFIRVFPLHFPTLLAVDVESRHALGLGELGISTLLAATSLIVAATALTRTTRPVTNARLRRRSRPHRLVVALQLAFAQIVRTPVLWILIIGLPIAFITTSIAVTPDTPTPVRLVEGGRQTLRIVSMTDVHGAVMVPITVGFLASLIGLFVILDSAQGDRRLSLTGFRTSRILAIRLITIGAIALVATAVSIGVTSLSFGASRWPMFVGANILVAWTYAMIGVIVAPVFGRLGGLYVLLLLPFVDVGIAQNAMFDAAPPAWGNYLPAHGAVQVMMDAAFTPDFDTGGALLLAIAWLVGLTVVALAVFRQAMRA